MDNMPLAEAMVLTKEVVRNIPESAMMILTIGAERIHETYDHDWKRTVEFVIRGYIALGIATGDVDIIDLEGE